MRPGYLEPGTAQGSDTWARREWDLAGRHDSQRHRNVVARVAVTFGLAPGAGNWIDATHDQIVTMPQNTSPADVADKHP